MVFSCKKTEPPCPDECLGANYNNYSTSDFDFVTSHLVGQSLTGPFFEFSEVYSYRFVVFNPNNPYEIAYTKWIANEHSLKKELWKFSFCTGEATKLSGNFYYNLDWGSNGWLLYTGENHQIFKIKGNGDSLTVLSTQSGYNRAGKWNPSGTAYWNYRDDGYYLNKNNGELIKKIGASGPIDWINSDLLLVSANLKLNSYSIKSNSFTPLNTNTISPPFIFDKENMNCYIPFQNGTGQDDYFVKYSLDGSNTVDTIKSLYDSYFYVNGDIANNKIVVNLIRQHWQDSLTDTRYVRENILIMDLDGTNERLIELP